MHKEREISAVPRAANRGAEGGTVRSRGDFLSHTSRVLADSLDYETTLAAVAGLALPDLGAWCIVDVVEETGAMRRLAIVHPDPEKQALARRLEAGWPPDRDDPFGAPLAMLTGRSEVIPEVTEPVLAAVARNQENLRILKELGIASLLVVPLLARGEVLGAITFVGSQDGHHYTAEDLAEAEDLAARAAIAIENARLYRAAQRAQAAAEEASRAKSQFLAITSHELRTPINAIIGYAQLLEMGLDGPLTEEQRTKLERIQASSQYLLGLINQVLDVAKVESGQLTVTREQATVAEAVEAALAIVQPVAAAKSLEIDNRCGRGLEAYLGDPIRVRQILLNLLVNACKFSAPRARITISCDTVNSIVPEARLAGTGPWLRIDVEDSGIGIPHDKIDAVFEPFVQVDTELTRDVGGSGLGLTISRRLARLMGGDLTVVSVPSQGSRFSLWLPGMQQGEADGAERSGNQDSRGLAVMAHLILERINPLMEGYVQRLRSDPGLPEAASASDVELRDHTHHLLSGIAGALASVESSSHPAGDLLRDGNTIQRVVAELHGAQRRRLGWRPEALGRDFANLRETVEQELRAHAPAALQLEHSLPALRRVFEQVQWISSRGWNLARVEEFGPNADLQGAADETAVLALMRPEAEREKAVAD